ncbi:Glyoxalase superfamily enzyme, possibly 3-demethylubiquinone-9 3-methyltransferase [Evansella caseinilytica]|uniref:Glyoxalase superfamily enzyme, possibly 3-demethylubiquinone-9 3-methyltransferase n=1 Tax=Evansella caseinilytica TaxID=1503961 RepID=A0A1H3RK81_9BACI|nr:VOC family protein [Evansella caseinilytica]SDZ26117.1 Glyoxalase superfamily enzyme, possibly 3-demethylubiquinone-9 3-methyltransferase [Evansella caseinilytica]
MKGSIQKITPNLWFDRQAEEAAMYYTSIFPNSSVGRISRYGSVGHDIHGMPEGTVMTVEFQLDGQSFVALNGGPHFSFTEATSFIVHCANQMEIDYYWEKLSEGGDEKAQACGWLKDKFGVSWQILPENLSEMIGDSDAEKAALVMKTLYTQKKINIDALMAAYEG